MSQNEKLIDNDISTNKTILLFISILGICFCFFFLSKCTTSIIGTPENIQKIEACSDFLRYIPNGSNTRNRVVLDKDVIETLKLCQENAIKTFNADSVIPNLQIGEK